MDSRSGRSIQDNSKDKVEFDELLSAAGELGRYQWILFFATAPFYAFATFSYFSQLFMTEVSPHHWCKIPELENFTDFERRDLAIPKDPNSKFGYSQCEMYAVNWTEVLISGEKPNPTWSTVPCQYGWEFNKSEIPYPTIGSDLEWVCEKNSYQAKAQSIFFIGAIFGGLVFGWVADRFGRIPAITSSCLTGCVGGAISTFARNITEFAAARFFMGMAYDTCLSMAFLLFLEYISPQHRTMMANLSFAIFYSLFATIMPWIALACGHWQIISLVTSLPFALAIFMKFILPESSRWLLSQGRVDDAIEKVMTISRINKKAMPVKLIEQFKLTVSNAEKEQKQSWSEIFKNSVIRKVFILICLEYICCSTVFDGLVRNVQQLDFDFFMSFSFLSVTELPSAIIVAFIMDYVGRRWMSIACMLLSCIFCLLTIFSSGILTVIFAVSARFCFNMAFNAAMQWAPELLPTPVRGSGVAIVHMCGFIGFVASSYIAYLKVYVYWLPLTLTGAIALIGMCIAFALPETAYKDMPHTFENTKELTRNQRLWTLPYLELRKRQKRKIEQVGQVNQGTEDLEA